MKNLYLIILLCLFHGYILAQTPTGNGQIKGKVIDSAGKKPLDFITISLKNDKKVAVKTALTKADGTFILSKLAGGNYTLDVVAVGYKPKTTTLNVNAEGVTDAGVLAISSSSQQLKEVSVTAVRPLVQQEVDRISYDVQADPESKSLNVLDLMRKVPLLSLDAEENIKMKGSGDYKILINGKPSTMVARNPKDVFKAMPASSIQKIEVITTPPAKYDAEGLTGIINIITNKKVDNGYNGSINVRGSYPSGGPGGGGSFTMKQGKFGLSSYLGSGVFRQPETENFNNRFTTGDAATNLFQNGTNKSNGYYGYFNTELSFEIDTLNLITGEVGLNKGNFDNTNNQISQLTNTTNALLQGYRLANNGNSDWQGIDLSLNYQLGFKNKKERILTFSYKFSNSMEGSLNQLDISDAFQYAIPNYRQTNKEKPVEQTIQADYVHPVGKSFRIEGGVKAILRDNNSDFQYLNFDNGSSQYIIDPARSNQYTNNQDVYGAYNTYQYNAKNWSVKAGLRLEKTIVNADFISQAAKLDRDYTNLLPSVSLNRKFKDMSSVNVGFSQRIQRPNIWNLNPFVDRSNPNFISTGNPDLLPVLNNNIEFGYSKFKKGSINLSMSYSFANNTIQRVSLFDAQTQITSSTYQNIGKNKSLGGNFNGNYPLTKEWNISVNGNMRYIWIEGIVGNVLEKNSGLNGYFSANTSYKLKKEWRISASAFYSSPYIMLQGKGNSWFNSNLSATKDVIKDKLSLSAYVSNPFSKYRSFSNETAGVNFTQSNINQQYYRNFNLSLNYKFGKLKEGIKKNERGIKNDDSSGGGGAKTGS